MGQELADASDLIDQALGTRPTTFAYPCGQKFVGRGVDVQSYVPLVAKSFLAGRGYRDQNANDPSVCDLAQLLGRDADNWPASTIKTWIDEAVQKGLWLVLVGHAVGGSSPLGIAIDNLEELCRYASDPELGLWVDTVANVAAWIARGR
ncbi:MAG TPA: hypothetical protein VFW40_06590, partial [Capsulimonadaceae bacterium]|nr:hypothetical protein [Capsulimonadaceae bacterium]